MRFRPPPPPPVWVCFRRPPLFLFPCLFRVRPLRARCVGVGVFSWFLLFFLCVPRPVFLLSSSHLIVMLIFTFISCHPHLHLTVGTSVLTPPRRGVCVCVKHLNRCKTSNPFFHSRGVVGILGVTTQRRHSKFAVICNLDADCTYLQDSLVSTTSLIMFALDSVPYRSYEGSFFV